MSIDINEDVRIWGGFSVEEFWIGAGALLVVALLAVGIGLELGGVAAMVWLLAAGGGLLAFLLYQRDLPKGYLLRRWRQEGKILFLRVGGGDTDVYLTRGRSAAFDNAMKEHEGNADQD